MTDNFNHYVIAKPKAEAIQAGLLRYADPRCDGIADATSGF